MADGISIDEVRGQKHLVFASFDPTTGEPTQFLEVFTGIIQLGWNAGSTVDRWKIASFLPLSDSTDIHTYDGVSLFTDNMTCTVSVATFQLHEDEEGLAGVDNSRVVLEPQSFSGVGGSPGCLILVADLALMNGTMHSINYHVTVTYGLGEGSIDTLGLNGESPNV